MDILCNLPVELLEYWMVTLTLAVLGQSLPQLSVHSLVLAVSSIVYSLSQDGIGQITQFLSSICWRPRPWRKWPDPVSSKAWLHPQGNANVQTEQKIESSTSLNMETNSIFMEITISLKLSWSKQATTGAPATRHELRKQVLSPRRFTNQLSLNSPWHTLSSQ